MEWAEDYIRRCLSGIPQSKYRERLQSELADHLAQLVEDVSRAGRSEAEAQAEALRQMGDADALDADYRSEWLRQPERRRWDLSRMLCGSLLGGIFSFLVLVFVGVLWNVMDGPLRDAPIWIFGAVLYLSSAVPNALFLRAAFRGRPDRRALMIAGLLLTWCIGKGSMMLVIVTLYGHFFPLPAYNLRVTGSTDGFWTRGTIRWFTYPYLVWTLAACPLVGWLFTLNGREEKPHEGSET